MKVTIVGFCFLFLIWFTAFIGVPFVLGPGMLFALPFGFYVNRNFQDFWAFCWFHLPVGLIELIHKVKICVSGDDLNQLNKNESALIIMNHRTRLDWMYFWCFLIRYGNIRHLKIILKSPLKKPPGLGWAIQHFGFIFLNRKWEEDEQYFSDILEHYAGHNYPIQLLLFPEGTDLSENNKKRNLEYEKSNNLKHLEYLIHPRVKGFQHTVSKLRNTVDAVWDISIGYPDFIPQTEESVFQGKFPKEVHFHFKRYAIEEIPTKDEELATWLQNCWTEKEQRLEAFYKEKKFPESVATTNITFSLLFGIIGWIVKTSFWLVLLYYYPFARWYFLIVAILYQVLTVKKSIDLIELEYFKNKNLSTKKND